MPPKLTPMMEQYTAIKDKYKEELLFFRLGDFYELFFDDAIKASKELSITLTGRAAGQENKAPMCGVPYHAAESYILKLIKKGYKVAICEQVEDPSAAKGIVKREVIRVVTPGTVFSEEGTEARNNNFLAVVTAFNNELIFVFTDVSTGEAIWISHVNQHKGNQQSNSIMDALSMYRPTEIILVGSTTLPEEVSLFVQHQMSNVLYSHFGEDLPENRLLERGVEQFGTSVAGSDGTFIALGALLYYLEDVIKINVDHIRNISQFISEEHLLLDSSCLRHLEISRNLRDGSTKGTLLSILDKTKTPMGSRLLKQWLESPLRSIQAIQKRQQGVEELCNNHGLRYSLGESLDRIFDFERILTRIETGSVSPRDMAALRESLQVLPTIRNMLSDMESEIGQEALSQIEEHYEIRTLLEEGLASSPPTSLKDGHVIADHYNETLDELRSLAEHSEEWLAKLEADIKEETGLRLKTGYNKVFGYYFEVSHANTIKVPDYFIRKQTLANAERYITPELKEFEIKILGAKDRIIQLEQQLFLEIKDRVREVLKDIQTTARALARIDVIRSLSEVAYEGRYIKPILEKSGRLIIKDGRHPVVESFLKREVYVPNDTVLNHEDQEFLLITGPNMAGKSTYMRQVAILMIMAQMGSFIPAAEAHITPVDRIFTRVGASDDIATGQSTFMVEMKEVAYILDNATSQSLIILDEIGRGTSTFDGLSIARAVVEYIVEKIKAKTLFATHYHELISLENMYDRVKNYTVAVKEKGSDILFLRRIIRGGADRSYGIHVAKLAGLPTNLLTRANTILEGLETEGTEHNPSELITAQSHEPAKDVEKNKNSAATKSNTNTLFTYSIMDRLAALDILSMTPIEALNMLHQLQEEARKGDGI